MVDRHHHFIGRQKRVLIRSRSNRDVGVGDQGNLSPGALENRKVWVSEWSFPRKREKTMSNPRFLDFQSPRAPALASPLVSGLFDTPVPPTPSLSLRSKSPQSYIMCRGPGGAGGGEMPRGGGEPRGPSCPMGETGLGTRMRGVGRCLGGPGAWSPGTRGACRMARRREGRPGPARFRPRTLPPASFLSASRPAFAPTRCAPFFPAFRISPALLGSLGHPAAPAQVPWPLYIAPACGE